MCLDVQLLRRGAGVMACLGSVGVMLFVVGSALGAPDIGGTPIHVEDDIFTADDWGIFVSSYVYDDTSELPGNFALDPGEMLFIYLLDGDDDRSVSVDQYSVGNPELFPVNTVGWDDTIIPDGFELEDFQDPHLFGYSVPAQAIVWTYANNPFDPFSTLEPDEWSLVFYIAESPTWMPVSATASGAGMGDNQIVPGPAPEPTTLGILLVGALGVLRRRR